MAPIQRISPQYDPANSESPRYLPTSNSFLPVTLPARGPMSKVIWTTYLPLASLGTRHECEQKPPHEKPRQAAIGHFAVGRQQQDLRVAFRLPAIGVLADLQRER